LYLGFPYVLHAVYNERGER